MQGHIEKTEDGRWRAVAGRRERVFRLHRGAENWLVRRGAKLPREMPSKLLEDGAFLASEDAELAVTMAVRAWGGETTLACVERMAKALGMDHRAVVPTMRRHGITISAERRRQKEEHDRG